VSGGGHGKRRHRGGHEEEHENHERWMVSYADMLTLLFVLFVVLFAISQVDQRKFAALKNGLAAGFGADTPFDGGTGVRTDNGAATDPVSISPDLGSTGGTPAERKVAKDAVAAANAAKAAAQMADAQREVDQFRKLQKQIATALAAEKVGAAVRFTIDSRGLVVTVVTSSVVFGGDSAQLLPAGQRILAVIGPTLRPLRNSVEVDGHTNQLRVPTRSYPSAWELSCARASAVVRYLVDRTGLSARRMSASGYAGERPLYPPTDPRAVTLNRRVEIVVLSTLPAEERGLLPTAAQSNAN
jgi:chemotaxis protein MotB